MIHLNEPQTVMVNARQKSTNLNQSNIKVVVLLPRAMFPVPVIIISSTWSHFSLHTTRSRGTSHALFSFCTISAVAAWWPVLSIYSVMSRKSRRSLQARVWVLCHKSWKKWEDKTILLKNGGKNDIREVQGLVQSLYNLFMYFKELFRIVKPVFFRLGTLLYSS